MAKKKPSNDDVHRLASVVESAEDAIFTKALDGTIQTWNRAAEKLYGYSIDEIKGRHVSLLIPPERLEELRKTLEDVQHEMGLKHHRTASVRKDGSRVPVSLTISPLRDSRGKVVGTSTIARDISQRLKEEEELRKTQEELRASLKELELRNKQLNLFSQMAERLNSAETAEEGYPIIAEFGKQIFPSEAGALYVINASRTLAERVSSWGECVASEGAFALSECWALRLGKLHVATAGQSAMRCQHLRQSDLAGMAGYLCNPVLAQGQVFALFYVQVAAAADQPETSFPEMMAARQQRIVTFCERSGLSLANVRLREQLRYQSIRDPLTGLFNHSYLEQTLEREVSRAARERSTVGVIMLDIDHFKRFNDTFGHDAGDVLLREVGYFLQGRIRKEDIACRYGGEEFTIVLSHASLEDTAKRAEQLRAEVREVHVKHQGQLLGPITFSFGVAAFPEHGTTFTEVLKAADNALYQAKAEGRDRVVAGEPSGAAGRLP
jgi:diguanylate cyclase (GGDEF)-like protein/PAS domain S-box-containing protein